MHVFQFGILLVCVTLSHTNWLMCALKICIFFFKPEKFFKKEKILDTTKKNSLGMRTELPCDMIFFFDEYFLFFLYVQKNGCMCVFLLEAYQNFNVYV